MKPGTKQPGYSETRGLFNHIPRFRFTSSKLQPIHTANDGNLHRQLQLGAQSGFRILSCIGCCCTGSCPQRAISPANLAAWYGLRYRA